MNQWGKLLKNLVWLSQLGLSILAPPLLCVWGCSWLQTRFGIGSWLMVVGLILGLGASVSSALHFYAVVRKQAEAGKKDKPQSYNKHD